MLTGKVVWITGAGSGIGRAIAQSFAASGARVALTGRRLPALEETAALIQDGRVSGNVMTAPADVAEDAQLARAHGAVVDRWGDVDILVNNAGWNIARRHWRDLEPAGAGQVIDLLLKAPFAASLAVLPGMRARGGGTIIHIASLAGVMIHPVSGPSYTAAKTAVTAMSDSLNAEEGIHGIRSVCICPGETATPILETRLNPPSEAERALMMQPEDIAAAALFCASLPPRTCVTRMVIQPTDDNAFRALARRIETTPPRAP